MTNVKNQKTVLFAIAAIVAVIAVSTIAIGSGRIASAAETTTITKNTNNTGVNTQADTNQKQECLTAGANSGLANSCTESSSTTNTESGGMLHK
ncbi:MAG: hypothetical protein WA364_20855 [Candidatus Nitrosopolaris sp.]|jgi:anionic cell wall polymer biosynthesis LytR-Cps2A-Psr (LCP) family protein